jgi:hypothetical protein
VKRREFITLLGGAAAPWPLAARAQQGERMRRIGVLIPAATDDKIFQARLVAFVQELQQLGWPACIRTQLSKARRRDLTEASSVPSARRRTSGFPATA